MTTTSPTLKIGWAAADITPDQPVCLAGQFHARVSEGVLDPVTATALALESADGAAAIMISCEMVSIAEALRDAVRARVKAGIAGFDPKHICLNATHTHSAPLARPPQNQAGTTSRFGLTPAELGIMDPADYIEWAAERIADAAIQAWNRRAPGGIGFGLGQAVVGRNRRISYLDGESRMYGKTGVPEFSHIEGYEDHDVNLLCTYDLNRKLTGIVVNVACPAQVSEQIYQISADYWHDTRVELRRRLGEDLFILPQCGAAGDQSPHVLINQTAEARMLALQGMAEPVAEIKDNNLGNPAALRKEIARRIADAVNMTLPVIGKSIAYSPVFRNETATIEISRRNLTEADVRESLADAAPFKEKFEALRADLDAHPEKKQIPHWYVEITKTHSRMQWYQGVATRFEEQR
ncbi:MAG: hypothetical protein ABR497_10720, partial [Kiritimatiellia bacterium]